MKRDLKNGLLRVPSLRSFVRRVAVPVSLSALAAVAFLALPAGASARGSDARKQPGTSAEFTVPGTNGYSLDVKSEDGTVTVVAADQRPPVATISATGGIRLANTGNVSANTYVTFGAPRDPNVVDANLGSLGRISVTFQPSGKVRITKVNLKNKTTKCVAARRIVRRLGTFTGTIQFAGEGGYTTVDLPSAAGSVGTSPFRNCTTKPGASGSAARSSGVTWLSATDYSNGLRFGAATTSTGVMFTASTVEQSGEGLTVLHTAQAVARSSSFVFDNALSSATVMPPGPFSGRGRFQKGQGTSSSWTGSLSVAFPGDAVPLTGSSFKATLMRSR